MICGICFLGCTNKFLIYVTYFISHKLCRSQAWEPNCVRPHWSDVVLVSAASTFSGCWPWRWWKYTLGIGVVAILLPGLEFHFHACRCLVGPSFFPLDIYWITIRHIFHGEQGILDNPSKFSNTDASQKETQTWASLPALCRYSVWIWSKLHVFSSERLSPAPSPSNAPMRSEVSMTDILTSEMESGRT